MKHKPVNNGQQAELVGLIWQPYLRPFRLRAGDVIVLKERLCRVVRVTECAAVVIMNQPVRRFKTRFDKPVEFHPAPALIRIAADSEVSILNRRAQKRSSGMHEQRQVLPTSSGRAPLRPTTGRSAK